MKSGAIAGVNDGDRLQIWSSILQVQIIAYIIYHSKIEMLTYIHNMPLETS